MNPVYRFRLNIETRRRKVGLVFETSFATVFSLFVPIWAFIGVHINVFFGMADERSFVTHHYFLLN